MLVCSRITALKMSYSSPTEHPSHSQYVSQTVKATTGWPLLVWLLLWCSPKLSSASTFLCGSNPANLRIRGPSLASFTHELSERPDRSHTKRAINIIHSPTHGMPYSNALFFAGLTSLRASREQVARKFFESTSQATSCLHHLLPPPRDPELLSRLRAPSKYPRTSNRTKSTSRLFRSRSVTIRLARFLLLSNLWLWLRLYTVSQKKVSHRTLQNIFAQGWRIAKISMATESEIISEHKCVINVLIFNVPKCCHLAN